MTKTPILKITEWLAFITCFDIKIKPYANEQIYLISTIPFICIILIMYDKRMYYLECIRNLIRK